MAQSKLDYVDALRGVAILGVVWLHFTGLSGFMALLPAGLKFVVDQGGHGVQLFFVVSAFTLFRSYHHRAGIEPNARRNFFLRRYFRIAPMYYVGIMYYLWQNGTTPIPFSGAVSVATPGNVLANLTFLHEFDPYYLWLVPGSWSIATEMMFYLLVPLLFRWVPDLKAALRFFGIAIIIRLVSWYLCRMNPWIPETMLREIYAGWVLPTQLPVFSLGFVLFYLMRGDAWPRLPKWDLLFWAGLLFAEVFTRGQRIFASEVVLSMGFVVLAVGFSKLEWGHLPGRALRHVGKISFSMYVIHWGVMYWMHYFGWAAIPMQLSMPMSALHYAWRFGLLLVLAVAISTATYYCVELPGQRLGDKLIQRLQRKITSPQ